MGDPMRVRPRYVDARKFKPCHVLVRVFEASGRFQEVAVELRDPPEEPSIWEHQADVALEGGTLSLLQDAAGALRLRVDVEPGVSNTRWTVIPRLPKRQPPPSPQSPPPEPPPPPAPT